MHGRRLAAVPDIPGRAVAYIRVSALMGRGGEDFHSPTIQLGVIRRAIGSAGLAEVAVVDDDIDESGRRFERPGMARIREMAEADEIDALVVYNVARFGRNVLEGLTTLAWLADRGVRIVSATEPIDTSTPAGRLMLTQMLATAEYQSDEIGEGWKRVHARLAAEGRHKGCPIGYQRQKGAGLAVDPVLGPVVTEAFRRYAAGHSTMEICRYIAAHTGIQLSPGNLKPRFRNPAYRGLVVRHGETMPGVHDPLVDEDTWTAVQHRLAAEAGPIPPRHHTPTWSLVQLAYCPDGHRLIRNPMRYRGQLVQRLKCGRSSHRTALGCAGIGMPLLDLVERQVLADVRAYVSRLRLDDAARATRMARQSTARGERDLLTRELERTRAGMVRLAGAWAVGDVPDAVYRETMAGMRATESAVSVELARLRPAAEHGTADEAATAAEALLDLWPRMTMAERNLSLRSVVSRVVVRRAAVWREPESARTTTYFHWKDPG